jgi:hypothetical protein
MNYYALALLLFVTVVLIQYSRTVYIAKKDKNTRILYLNTKNMMIINLVIVSLLYTFALILIVLDFLGETNNSTYLFLGLIPLLIVYNNVAIINTDTIRVYFSRKIKIENIKNLELKENKRGKKILVIYTSKYDTITVRGNCEKNLIAFYNYLNNVKTLAN